MKIFQMNVCDWWMAPTLEEAIADMKANYGDDPCLWEGARELTKKEMRRLKYVEDVGALRIKRTFLNELNRRIAAGAKTQMFATTEI